MAEHTVNYLEPIEEGTIFVEDYNSHLFFDDKVINEYMNLITQRSPDTVYVFDTFFYPALSDKGYDNVKSWTNKIDIFSKQKLFIPIHIEGRWCLVYVCLPRKSIKYYDSMGGRNFKCLKSILPYLMSEHNDKKGEELDKERWLLGFVREYRQKLNTWDSGVFVCMYAKYLSRDAPINFSVHNIDRYREQIALEIKEKKLKTSVPRSLYYNDEVISNYMDLITQRSPDTVYAFNTFFYLALSDKGYNHVCRWTKNVDIFSKQKLFIPIHIEDHWCLVYVCFPRKSIKYYDSLGRRNLKCLKLILKYLMSEHDKKKGEEFNRKGWNLHNVRDNPQQLNTWDCGVFVCMYAEYLSRGAPLNFTQQHMQKFRRQIELEINNKKLNKSVPETLTICINE